MECEKHGTVEPTADGFCPECLKVNVAEMLEKFAREGETPEEQDSECPPFSYVATLRLTLTDLPWLNDETIPAAVRQRYRWVLVRAYFAVALRKISGRQFTGALEDVVLAASYEPESHWLWWQIHYLAASCIKDDLNVAGKLEPVRLADSTMRSLIQCASHTYYAVKHRRLAGSTEAPYDDSEEAGYAQQLLEALQAEGFFRLNGETVIAIGGFRGSRHVSECLTDGIPPGL